MRALADRHAECIHTARERALVHLLNRQSPEGAFCDFHLPVGISDAWTTAFVGALLATGPDARAQDAAHRAAVWLRAQSSTGVWGYNRYVQPDADSTAWAALLFSRLGLGAGLADLRFFQQLRRPGGGFATFETDDAWGLPHDCVTAAVLQVPGCATPAGAAETAGWLRRARPPGDAWSGYWWATPFYPTMVCLEALAGLGSLDPEERLLLCEAPGLRLARSVLDLAAALRIAGTVGLGRQTRFRIANSLLKLQDPDGGFPPSRALRVTRHTICAPQPGATHGRLYSDTERVFGTAIAWAALRELDAADAGPFS